MAVCYIAIFCLAYFNSKQPVRMERYLQNSKGKIVYNHMTKVKHRTLKQVIKDHKSDVKVALTVSIVIFTFVASWLPSFVAEMSYFRTADPNKLLNSYSLTSHIVFWMVYISPTLNPIIYAMHNTTIRRMVIRMIKHRQVYRTATTHFLGASTLAMDPSRRSIAATESNLDVVKNMNPVQPFRRRASTIVGLLIQRSLNRKDNGDEISDEVIRENDELVSDDELSDIETVHSVIDKENDEIKPKKRVSICLDNGIHIPGEPTLRDSRL